MADFIPVYPDSDYEAVYISRDSDTNAITANGNFTSYNNIRVRKSGDTNSALAPSTGVNAGVLAKNKADLTLYDSYITADGKYAPAIFGKDVDTSVKLYRSSINTNGEYSPAIETYGGAIESYNNDLITNGENSPAINIYGYTTTVRGGSVITRGENSPIAKVRSDLVLLTVDDLISEMSDGVYIVGDEGEISSQDSNIRIRGAGFYPDEEDTTDYSKHFSAVKIGVDGQRITGTFTANMGSIDVQRPEYTSVFKIYNAKGYINLTDVKINSETDTNLIYVDKGQGTDDAEAIVTCINQTIKGRIETDNTSVLNLYLKASSGYTGRINPTGQKGEVEVTLISSFWSLTGDSYISKLYIDDKSAINTNGYTLWVSGQKYVPKDQPDEPGDIEYDETFENYENNQNAVNFTNTSGILSTVRVIKEGNTNELDANEYGMNAAVLGNQSNVTVANYTYITSEGKGSPGVVSYNNSYTSVNDAVIETSGENSSAVASSHGSSLYVYNSTFKTSGRKAHTVNVAPLSSTVYLNGGTYIAEGEESSVVYIDKLNKGSVKLSDLLMRSNYRGIEIQNPQPSAISLSKVNISSTNSAIYINDDNNDHTNITVDITDSNINSSDTDGAILVDSAKVTLNLSKTSLSGNRVISAINGSVLYINVSGGYISGNIYADGSSMIYLNLMEEANIVGGVDTDNTANKIETIMRDSHWVVTRDSYVTSLDIDKYSRIDIGEHVLYVNGEASEFIVGSVVHYTSDDGFISEEDVVIIERTTIGETTYYTLYDTDDRITYNDVLIDNIVFTGKIIDIEPILQLIDELARDESAGVVESGDIVVVATSDKHGLIVDNRVEDLHDVQFKKTGDSKICNDTANCVVYVLNTGDLTLKDSDIQSKATYANGIVVTGDQSVAKLTNIQFQTESYNSSAAVVLDQAELDGTGLHLKTLGPNSFGLRVEDTTEIPLEDRALASLNNTTIEVTGAGSNGVILANGNLYMKNCTVSHDRSIAPIDISGESNFLLSGGNISDNSSEIATGGLYIHNERSTDPVYPDGYDPDENPPRPDPDPEPGPDPGPGPDPDVYVRRAVYHYTVDTDLVGGIYTSSIDTIDNPNANKDEIVIWASAAALVQMNAATVNRMSENSTGGKNARQYGVGAAILSTNGGFDIVQSTINTLAIGGIAVFAFSEDSVINLTDTSITTLSNESSALHAADGGIITANTCTVTTGTGINTSESALIQTDKGGGKITVNGGSYRSAGLASPAIKCLDGDITVENTMLVADNSELIDIIGKGSVSFDNVTSQYRRETDGRDNCNWGIGFYQVTDAINEDGPCVFNAKSGSITCLNGGLFYITNAEAEINLDHLNITGANNLDFLIKCTGNTSERGWGEVGSNGGKCTLTAIYQTLIGKIYWDSLSQLTINIGEGSTITTSIIDDESHNGGAIGAEGFCDVNIDSQGKFIANGNCRLRNLVNNSEYLIRDTQDRIVTVVNYNNTLIIDGNSEFLISVNTYTGIVEEN